jgi:hypothetical protein
MIFNGVGHHERTPNVHRPVEEQAGHLGLRKTRSELVSSLL